MTVIRNLMVLLFLCPFLSQNAALGQKLRIGDKAPDFEAIETNGAAIRLADLKGQKTLVAFFRYAGCPVCNFRIHELIENFDRISSEGYRIIAIYESNNNTLNEYLSETSVPFSVIGDPELNLYKAFGVEKSFWKTMGSAFKKQPKEAAKKGGELFTRKYKKDGQLTRLPADFLLDENGIITAVHYGSNIGDHLPISKILNQ